MANCWLLKTEPSAYSFERLQRDGRAVWDGVSNPQALKFIAQIKEGDALFVYHTGDEKAVIGVAIALSDAYPDPKSTNSKLLVFDLRADRPLSRPVTLASIKADSSFAGWELVRLPRLSVMPVSAAQWTAIERMAAR